MQKNEYADFCYQFKHKIRTLQNQIFSVSPIVFPVPNPQVDLEMKVTAPVNVENLPVILFSHGHGAEKALFCNTFSN